MSNLDDLDLNDSGDDSGADGPAALRALVKKLQGENKSLRETNEKFATSQRESTVASALQAAGANARIAKYIPKDVTDTAGVQAWLKDNGEDFGYQPKNDSASDTSDSTQTDSSSSTVSDDAQKIFQRIQDSERLGEVTVPNTDAEKFLAELGNAGSFDKARSLIEGR